MKKKEANETTALSGEGSAISINGVQAARLLTLYSPSGMEGHLQLEFAAPDDPFIVACESAIEAGSPSSFILTMPTLGERHFHAWIARLTRSRSSGSLEIHVVGEIECRAAPH